MYLFTITFRNGGHTHIEATTFAEVAARITEDATVVSIVRGPMLH